MQNVFVTKTPISKEQQTQLAKPHGIKAIEVGEHLFTGNSEVIDQLIDKIVYNPDLSIIDIGVGPGYSLIKIAEKFPEAKVIGADPSPEMVQFARLKIGKINNPNVKLIVGETPNLPLDSGQYNYALLANVIYFWDDPLKHLIEINRILKKNGSILIYFTAKESLSERINEADGVFKMYNPDQVTEMLLASGYKNVTCSKIHRKIGQTGYIITGIKC